MAREAITRSNWLTEGCIHITNCTAARLWSAFTYYLTGNDFRLEQGARQITAAPKSTLAQLVPQRPLSTTLRARFPTGSSNWHRWQQQLFWFTSHALGSPMRRCNWPDNSDIGSRNAVVPRWACRRRRCFCSHSKEKPRRGSNGQRFSAAWGNYYMYEGYRSTCVDRKCRPSQARKIWRNEKYELQEDI